MMEGEEKDDNLFIREKPKKEEDGFKTHFRNSINRMEPLDSIEDGGKRDKIKGDTWFPGLGTWMNTENREGRLFFQVLFCTC